MSLSWPHTGQVWIFLSGRSHLEAMRRRFFRCVVFFFGTAISQPSSVPSKDPIPGSRVSAVGKALEIV